MRHKCRTAAIETEANAKIRKSLIGRSRPMRGNYVPGDLVCITARRKRVEVSERKLTESDRKLFRKAKELELQSWLDHRVFDLVKKKFVDQERVMRGRWVLTWKSTGKAKARLCVLGFQDPDLTEVPRDSPTLSAASEALIMQWVASHKYRLISGDIKTAFLSGDEDVRNIFISPLDDVRQNAEP